MYLNLFFKSVKADVGKTENNERVKALIRRFVQVLVSGGGGATEFIAGGLFLLGEVSSYSSILMTIGLICLLALQQHTWTAFHHHAAPNGDRRKRRL